MEAILDYLSANWVGWFFAVGGSIIGYIYVKVIAVTAGVRALLRKSIIDGYNEAMDRGYCPIYARENIQDMYDQYHALKGNGTVTHLVEEIYNLPTEDRSEKH